MRAVLRLARKFFTVPASDFWHGYVNCLDHGLRGFVLVLAGLVAGWWIYVPIHELLHAAGCVVTGGSVSELEIDELYGGSLLARIFPFVTAGGDYAGRLSGFDTGGSDLIYLATVLAPFLLTVFPGVLALRRSGAASAPGLFGISLPFALAPFLSLTGDAYEIGSIFVTRLPPWSANEVLRTDDAVRLAETLAGTAGAPWSGFLLALVTGLLWAFATYALGVVAARFFSGRD